MFDNLLLDVFKQAIVKTVEDMTGVFTATVDTANVSRSMNKFDALNKAGIASIVGFSGKLKGRNLLWANARLASIITEIVVGETPAHYKDEMVLFTINEINNIVSGQATTILNNKHNLSLRLSPPSIFAGDSFEIITPNNKSLHIVISLKGESLYKKYLSKQDYLCLNVAVEGSMNNE